MDYDLLADRARAALIAAAMRRSALTYGELARAIGYDSPAPFNQQARRILDPLTEECVKRGNRRWPGSWSTRRPASRARVSTRMAARGSQSSGRASSVGHQPDSCKQWVDNLLADPTHLRPERGKGPEYDYQRTHAGPHNVHLETLDQSSKVWADGLKVDPDKVVAMETKYVVEPGVGKSMYEGGRPDFLMKQFDDEMARYGAVIRDPSNPVDRLRIVTNTEKAAQYLAERAHKIIGDGVDIQVIVKGG